MWLLIALAKEFPVDRTGSRRLLQLPVVGDARSRRHPDFLDANFHAQSNSTPDSMLPVPISQWLKWRRDGLSPPLDRTLTYTRSMRSQWKLPIRSARSGPIW